jgi:dTMP kinase
VQLANGFPVHRVALTPRRALAHAQRMNARAHYPGFLLVIEGIDGAGKSTAAQSIQEHLQSRGFNVVRTKEPTNGQWGKILRDSATTGRLSIEEEVETFIKDRREHVDTLIMPALRAGDVVIIDRYYFSTAAYQGARGLDPAELIRRNEQFAPEPDLLVLLDLEVTDGLTRIRTRGDAANHFEQTENLKRVRDIFLGIQKPYLVKLDARQNPQQLRDAVLREFVNHYEARIRAGEVQPTEKLTRALEALRG